jgi:hypothetical protein
MTPPRGVLAKLAEDQMCYREYQGCRTYFVARIFMNLDPFERTQGGGRVGSAYLSRKTTQIASVKRWRLGRTESLSVRHPGETATSNLQPWQRAGLSAKRGFAGFLHIFTISPSW